jgi:phage recombination protein Bet
MNESERALRATVAREATDAQWQFFLDFCERRGLDPYTRQAHWTRQGVITGIDGFRALAERTGEYRPGETRYDEVDGALIAAHVTVYRRIAGEWHPLTESAYMAEYAAASPLWRKMPRVMCAKVAEARALRRMFPSVLSGLYERAEMDQATDAQAPTQPTTPAPSPARRYADGVIAEISASPADREAILERHRDKLARLQERHPGMYAEVVATGVSHD